MSSDRGETWFTSMRGASIGAILGGPLGVLAGWLLAAELLCPAVAGACIGSLTGALLADPDDIAEAVVTAILPAGAWLVGAGGGWMFGYMLIGRHICFWGENVAMTLARIGALLGATIAVLVIVGRLGDRDLWRV